MVVKVLSLLKSNTIGIAELNKSIATNVATVGLLDKVPSWSVVAVEETTDVVAGVGANRIASGSIVFVTVAGAKVFGSGFRFRRRR